MSQAVAADAVPPASASAGRVDPRVVRSRQAVLAATVELLTEAGMAGVTVEAISQRSGVAKTTIYRHWPDASRLIVDAVHELAEPCADPDTGTLRGDLEAMLAGLARTLTSSPMAKVLPSLIDAAARDEEVASLRQAWTQERRSSFDRALARAAARGELRADVDADVVSSMAVGALFYRRLVAHQPLSPLLITKVVDAVVSMTTNDPRTVAD